jgi:hypothetical protein
VRFTMRTPCDNCPFRRKGGIRVHPERAREIAEMMLDEGAGGMFPCHKSVDYDRAEIDDEGDGYRVGRSGEVHCAGALVFAERQGFQTQAMQIAERLGMYDPDGLDAAADVFTSAEAMVDASRKGPR